MLSTAAMAATTAPRGNVPPPPKNGNPTFCIAACLPPADTNSAAQNYHLCADKLANLRRVTVGDVRRVQVGEPVHLVPLCDVVNHTLTEQQQRYLARGNVQGLIPVIARNPALMAELSDRGYDANDVIGIALAPSAAVLYVSRR
jgi:hypothetical protein